MTAPASRLYLGKHTAFRSLIARMKQDPAYRPQRYPAGNAGIRQAEEHLDDVLAVMEEVTTEGDG